MAPVIERVEVFPVRIPATAVFRFASGSTGDAAAGAPHVFVRVTDGDGAFGWGEARPSPQWSYETLESVTTTIRGYLGPAVVGLPVGDRWDLHRRMHRAIGRGPSTGQPCAKAAVDLAVHDLCARAAGLSLRRFLGGADDRASVVLSHTVVAHDAGAAAGEVRAAQQAGMRHFNFKAALDPSGAAGLAAEAELAAAIREAAGPAAFVWADANQGYRLHEARRAAEAFARAGVDVLEQPLPADRFELMAELRRQCSLPLAVDEASVGPADFLRHVAAGAVDYLVVKPTRSGGIWPTLQQIAVAEAAGLPLLVSGLTDSLLTKVATCQTALAFGFDGPAALNGSQFLDESALFPDKPRLEHGGAVHLDGTPGIGVAPDEAALRRFAVPGLA